LPDIFCFRVNVDNTALKAGNSFSVIYYCSENCKEGISVVLINECLLMKLKIRIRNEDRN